ncbi:MAG: hypothetical protein D6791_11250 [Chloroflexi bacterium]|nr:MAG: hypothetical protein D6791_11250 [Chloroflexota bacterium]
MAWLRRSGVRVSLAGFGRLAILFVAGAGLFWLAQPQGLLVRGAMWVAFPLLGLVLGSVTEEDVALLIPKAMLRRPIRLFRPSTGAQL